MACNDRFFAAAARLTAQPSRLANFALRLTTALSLCALLGACGFHLRSSATLPFESMFISGSPSFATLLGRAVRAGSSTRVTDNPKENERVILSLSGSGRVRELQLRYRVSYRLNDRDSRELLPVGEVQLKRDLTYNDSDVLGKEQEEGLLIRDMRNDAVQQVMRRLQTARLEPAAKIAP